MYVVEIKWFNESFGASLIVELLALLQNKQKIQTEQERERGIVRSVESVIDLIEMTLSVSGTYMVASTQTKYYIHIKQRTHFAWNNHHHFGGNQIYNQQTDQVELL